MCPKLEIKQWIIQERSLLSWSSRTRRAITEGKQISKNISGKDKCTEDKTE